MVAGIRGGDFCLTHVDLSNAFWSFLLPAGSEGMFRFRFWGKLWDMKRLPFGWKYSLVICQQLLGSLVRDLIPPDILLIHYLDDFLLVARDRARLREATGRVAARLREAKFLVSPKSTLEPTDSLHCLGKFFELEGGGGHHQFAVLPGEVGPGLVEAQRCAVRPA